MEKSTIEELEVILKEELEVRRIDIIKIIDSILPVLNDTKFISAIEALSFIIGILVKNNLTKDYAKEEFLDLIFMSIQKNSGLSIKVTDKSDVH